MRYCPNCSAEFKTVRPPRGCWNCDADFGKGSAWRPTDTPAGEFRPFRKEAPAAAPEPEPDAEPIEPREDAIQEGGTAFKTILRLFVGLLTIIPVVVALDAKMPPATRALYGCGALLGLTIILTIGRHYDFAMGLFLLAMGTFATLGGLGEQISWAHSLWTMGGFAGLAGLLWARGRSWPQPVRRALDAATVALGVPLLWLGLGNLPLAAGIVCVGLGILHLAVLFGANGSRKTV